MTSNISQDWGRLIFDCEAWFGSMVQQLPHTLFVAGAGNDAADDIAGICPAGLASTHDNVISVAGLDAHGTRLDAASNRGDAVKIAAPMETLAVSFVNSTYPPANKLMHVSGTSFAAATVSHAALRVLSKARAQHDDVAGRDMAYTLMRYCKPQGLPVACGGSLDLERLEHHPFPWRP